MSLPTEDNKKIKFIPRDPKLIPVYTLHLPDPDKMYDHTGLPDTPTIDECNDCTLKDEQKLLSLQMVANAVFPDPIDDDKKPTRSKKSLAMQQIIDDEF